MFGLVNIYLLKLYTTVGIVVRRVQLLSWYYELLTDNLEMDVLADMGRSGYLAFVDSWVSNLRVLDLQRPVLTGWLIDWPEPLVTSVCVPAHSKKVNVPMPDPRDLKQDIPQSLLKNLIKTVSIYYYISSHNFYIFLY